jgi:hypothetical protein
MITIIIIIHFPYFSAVSWFSLVLLTKHFLFTLLPETFLLYGMCEGSLPSALEYMEQGGDSAVLKLRAICSRQCTLWVVVMVLDRPFSFDAFL